MSSTEPSNPSISTDVACKRVPDIEAIIKNPNLASLARMVANWRIHLACHILKTLGNQNFVMKDGVAHVTKQYIPSYCMAALDELYNCSCIETSDRAEWLKQPRPFDDLWHAAWKPPLSWALMLDKFLCKALEHYEADRAVDANAYVKSRDDLRAQLGRATADKFRRLLVSNELAHAPAAIDVD